MLCLRSQIVAMVAALIVPCSALAADKAANKEAGPKGLFFEQLDHPTANINTGVRYWIELDRGHGPTRVSNKEPFHSGDKIRFHVSANIDGYAYIVLKSGSQGEQSVLFPDARFHDNNKIERGKEYTLPADDSMMFDHNPGKEQVVLLVSRQPIDATSYLARPSNKPVVIASSVVGSKDLVPAQVEISYSPPKKSDMKPAVLNQTTHESQTIVAKHSTEDGVTTIVKKSSEGVLYVSVDLDHRS